MANLTGPLIVSGGSTRSSNAYTGSGQQVPFTLGAKSNTRDGRVFRFAQNGAVVLVPGNVLQAAAEITAHQNLVVAATAAGAVSAVVTPGAAAGAANLYADGLAIVSTAPDLGSAYSVSGHGPITSTTPFTLNLASDDPIQVAWSAATRIDLFTNLYKGVIQAPVTTLTGAVAGVAVHALGASEYGWVQTYGPGAVLIDGTPAIGNLVSSPASVAGGAAINSTTLTIIGTMLATGVSGKCKAVFITIAP